MRLSKILGGALVVAFAAVGFGSFAFHSGGVAECEGCHSMHDAKSLDGNLLTKIDPSSTCLNCHGTSPTNPTSTYHVATLNAAYPGTMPGELTPGGDFGWLLVDFAYSYDTNGDGTLEPFTEPGQTHGHNIIAADYGFTVDTDYPQAPGGGTSPFNSASLGCQSCHDPHGKGRLLYNGAGAAFTYGGTGSGQPIYTSGSYYTSTTGNGLPKANTYGGLGHAAQGAPTGLAVGLYRLLWGPASPDKPANAAFNSYAIAIAPSSYNRSEDTAQTRVAYGGAGTADNWGNWCGACHSGYNVPAGDNGHHPTGATLGAGSLGAAVGSEATNYNAYVSSGKLDGDPNKAYSSLVPFAEATTSIPSLAAHAGTDTVVARTRGAIDGGEQVVCLTCHRAHASGFVDALRFDYGYEFMTKGGNYIGSDNPVITGGRAPAQHRGRTVAMWKRAYYERTAANWFGPYDRVLCNKCHAQD